MDTTVVSGNLACVEPGKDVSQFYTEWDAQNRQIAVTASIASPAASVEIVKSITLTAATSAGTQDLVIGSCDALTVATSAGLPGDFNLDGVVNILDATLFIQEWVRWHTASAPVFDPAVDGIYDLAPYTGTTWPDWTVQGDGKIDIEDAEAFVACWTGAHSSQGSSSSAQSSQSLSEGAAIPITAADDGSGVFRARFTLPANAGFDPSTNSNGNLANVDRGPGAGTLFFTEYDASSRTIYLTGSLEGTPPYVVGVVHTAN